MKFELEIPKEIAVLIQNSDFEIRAEFDAKGIKSFEISIYNRDKTRDGVKRQQQLVSRFRRIEGTQVHIKRHNGNAEIILPYPSRGIWGNRVHIYGIAEQITICNEADRKKAIEQLMKER